MYIDECVVSKRKVFPVHGKYSLMGGGFEDIKEAKGLLQGGLKVVFTLIFDFWEMIGGRSYNLLMNCLLLPINMS